MVSGINISIKHKNEYSILKNVFIFMKISKLFFIDIAMASDRIINIYQLGDTL